MTDRDILFLALAAVSACTSSAPDTEPPDRAAIAMSLADTTSPLIPSAATEATPELQLGRLGAAIPMAGHVVVLDMMPPHVKVYDSTGVGVRSFLQGGEGPGEMQMPVAITQWDDSSVVVADVTGRLARWTLGGTPLAEGLGVPGLPVMGMARCGDDLALYGPSRDTSDATHWAWLRTVATDLQTVTRTGMREIAESGEIHGVGGRLYGVQAGDAGEITIRHQFGQTPGVVRYACTDLNTATRLPDLPPSVRMTPPSPGSGVVAPPRPTGPRPAGMAIVGDDVVLSSLLVPADSTDTDSTRFIVISRTGIDSVDVAGTFRLLSAAGGATLVGSSTPREGVRVVRTP